MSDETKPPVSGKVVEAGAEHEREIKRLSEQQSNLEKTLGEIKEGISKLSTPTIQPKAESIAIKKNPVVEFLIEVGLFEKES